MLYTLWHLTTRPSQARVTSTNFSLLRRAGNMVSMFEWNEFQRKQTCCGSVSASTTRCGDGLGRCCAGFCLAGAVLGWGDSCVSRKLGVEEEEAVEGLGRIGFISRCVIEWGALSVSPVLSRCTTCALLTAGHDASDVPGVSLGAEISKMWLFNNKFCRSKFIKAILILMNKLVLTRILFLAIWRD